MRVLVLKQKAADGRIRVWKLDSRSLIQTFGTSRKANLVSIDQEVSSYEAAFEYRTDGWHFISFDIKNSRPDQKLEHSTILHFPKSTMSFEFIEKDEHLNRSFSQIQTSGSISRQLYLVIKDDRVFESQVTEVGQPFYFFIHGKKHKFNIAATPSWVETTQDGFTIKSKIITVEPLISIHKMPKNEMLDAESRRVLIVTLGITLLFVSLSFLAPKKDSLTTEINMPKTAAHVVVKMDKTKPAPPVEKKTEAVPAKKDMKAVQQKQTDETAGSSAPKGGGSKVAALVKGAVSARISQLIGKVSATEARTANVIVTDNGIKAGEGASGRALAAVGKIEASGHNWKSESTGAGTGVSTAGVGGGKGTKGLGGALGKGKTGSGGVGLIEEESEITGGLDREVIAQYIKTQLGQILYCYERQLSASPDLYGKIAVKFTISGNGQVEAQKINDSTLKNSSVEGCILNKIAKWKFPEPKGGTKVLVTYPFLFKSTN